MHHTAVLLVCFLADPEPLASGVIFDARFFAGLGCFLFGDFPLDDSSGLLVRRLRTEELSMDERKNEKYTNGKTNSIQQQVHTFFLILHLCN